MSIMRVWVVTHEQSFANCFRVVGVFATEKLAREVASLSEDYRVEQFDLEGWSLVAEES